MRSTIEPNVTHMMYQPGCIPILMLLLPYTMTVVAAVDPGPVTQTQYLYVSTDAYPERTETIERGSTFTQTISALTNYYTTTLHPTATPRNALTTVTDLSNPSFPIVQVLLPPEATNTRTVGPNETHYYVPITFHPFQTCEKYKQNWTTSTIVQIPLYLTMPSDLREHIMDLTPMSMTPSPTSWYSRLDYSTGVTMTKTVQIAILNPTDLPAEVLSKASNVDYPLPMSYCQTPTSSCSGFYATLPPTPTIFRGQTTLVTMLTMTSESCTPVWSPDPRWTRDNVRCCDSSFGVAGGLFAISLGLSIPGAWIVLCFCGGAIEARYQLGKLYRGQEARGGLPPLWGATIVCLCFCFGRGPRWRARSATEQMILNAKWESMTAGERYRIWRKWGYTTKYPVEDLGDEPERIKRGCC